jgi:N-acetyl-anhydromuramyl-L-alanine amidase AmpD
MRLIQLPSPNHGQRPASVEIDAVTLHADASTSAKASAEWCCTPPPKNPKPVSYHNIVERDGAVYRLVDVRRRAWHAGKSSFRGRVDVNDFSIGLCFSNRNDGTEKFTDLQYSVGAALVALWMREFPQIAIDRIHTHAAVRDEWLKGHPATAEVKTDPRGFDMTRFRTLVAFECAELAALHAVPRPLTPRP